MHETEKNQNKEENKKKFLLCLVDTRSMVSQQSKLQIQFFHFFLQRQHSDLLVVVIICHGKQERPSNQKNSIDKRKQEKKRGFVVHAMKIHPRLICATITPNHLTTPNRGRRVILECGSTREEASPSCYDLPRDRTTRRGNTPPCSGFG